MRKLFAGILVALDGITATYARRASLAILAGAIMSATAVYAQTTSGDIVGTVTDTTGALVPNAQVTATNQQTNVKYPTTANGNGEYRISNLPSGSYDVAATAAGFSTKTAQGFDVQLNKQGTLNIQLAPAGASQTVEVSAAAAVALDTTTVQLQQTFSNQELSTLPTATVGLGVLNVSLLSPNVATSGGIGAGTGPSVGGQRPRANNFTIEGIDNNNKGVTGPLVYLPNDSVGEFTLITNQFSPEFGHSTGGQFNTTVLSGTNKFHGRAYEYFQNRNLNAIDTVTKRSFLGTGLKPKNPRFDFNRYGGQLGGPILKDRLFFFTNYERQTTGQGFSYPVCTPTAAGFATLAAVPGLSATNVAIFTKFTPVSPQAADDSNDAACFGKANAAGVQVAKVGGQDVELGNFQVKAPNTLNFKSLTTSGDWTISTTDSFRLRYLYNDFEGVDTAAVLPAFFLPLPQKFHLVALSEFHNFTPNLTNEARIGFNRFTQVFQGGNFQFPGLDVFPNLTFQDMGFLNIGPDGNAPQSAIQNTYQFTDNISWVKGAHTFKFGFDGRKSISPQTFTQRGRGDYQWTNADSYFHDLAPDQAAGVGERSTGNFVYYGDQTSLFGYANDTWRVRPNLTLNYGIRYEFTSVPVGERAQQLNIAASVPGLVNFHKPQPQYKNFAPRVGIDYAPNDKTSIRAGFGMAYDVIYDNLGLLSFPPQYSATQDVGSAGQPDFLSPNFLANGGLHPGTGQLQTFATIADQRAATAAFVPDQKLPYSESYSLGIQHVFGQNYTAEVRYLGTRGIHLPAQDQLNIQHVVTPSNFIPTDLTGTAINSSSTTTLAQVRKGNGQRIDNGDGTFPNAPNIVPAFFNAGFYSKITTFLPVAESNYNSLAASLIRRFRNGLQLDFAYTWSRTMDDATADVFSTVLTPRRPFDSQNVSADYSRSALDRTHRLTLEALYDLPFYKGNANWFLKNIVSNWEVAPVYTYQSPEYATVESTTNSSLSGDSSATSRVIINPNGKKGTSSAVAPTINPALTPQCGLDKKGNQIPVCSANTVGYYAKDPSAYYIQALAGTIANSGRNTLPLRPTNNVDMTAVKRINITERYAFEFQAQAFNVLNHHQFIAGSINQIDSLGNTAGLTQTYLTVGSGNFNNPEQTFSSNPRTMQLAAKFIF
jgi:hypothetical protein